METVCQVAEKLYVKLQSQAFFSLWPFLAQTFQTLHELQIGLGTIRFFYSEELGLLCIAPPEIGGGLACQTHSGRGRSPCYSSR